MGRFGASKKDDLDDLGDSFNFDDIMGGGVGKPVKAPPVKQQTFGIGGANSGRSGSMSRLPPPTADDNDNSMFGLGGGIKKSSQPTMAKNDSFGGGSR